MSVKKTRIFVTGARGKIGSKLVTTLKNRGYEVFTLSRNKADILEIEKYKKEMRSCEVVYHLAAYQNVLNLNKNEFWRVNVEGTKVILEALDGSRVKKFVYVSTVMVKHDLKDNHYVDSKREALKLVKSSKVPWIVVYPGIVVEVNQQMGWWQRWLTGGIPGGFRLRFVNKKNTFRFIWMKDLVEELVRLVRNGIVGKEYWEEKEKMAVGEYLEMMKKLKASNVG